MVFRRRKLTDRVQTVVDEILHLLQKEPQSGFQKHRPSAVQAARLEDRVLMSASPMAILAEGAVQAVDASVAVMESGVESSADASVAFEFLEAQKYAADATSDERYSAIVDANETGPNSDSDEVELTAEVVSRPELVVIDYRVQDTDTLLQSLLKDGRDVRLLRLDMDSDGLRQITEKLEQVGNVSAIHLLTHGRDGEILLGSTHLNATTLAQHAPELLAWQNSLTTNADFLIYGCDVAESVESRDFLNSLSALTGADIAASTDATGSPAESGDWILEYSAGRIEQPGIFFASVMDTWQHTLTAGTSITVTTTNDVVDGNTTSLANLLANKGADGKISLREAILGANANADIDEIILTAGEYRIQITGHDDGAAKGDFDILEGVTIRGAGSSQTIINASSNDRIFDIRRSASVSISGLTITGGSTNEDGGGVRVSRNASLNFSQGTVSGNATSKRGGGLFNDGTATLTDVTLSSNTAGTDGGGINNKGTMDLVNVTLSGNLSNSGGGLFHDGADSSLSLTSVTISGNTATNLGGGLKLSQDASLTNVTIAFNTAGGSGAGIKIGTGSPAVTLQNVILSSNRLTNSTASNVNGTISSLGNNVSSDTTAGLNRSSDRSGVDPGLLALADNGGFTQTHALSSSSFAIDAGSSRGAPTRDQRGVARDLAVDIGAYEFDRAFLNNSQFSANTTTAADQMTSAETRGSQNAIARDHAGNYVVVWSSNTQDVSGWGVYAQRFDSFGNTLGSEFRINSTTTDNQQWANVAADRNGNFVVTWTSSNQDGTAQSLYARRYSAAGVALGTEFLVNTTTTGIQKNSTVSMNSSGQFVIAWQGEGPGDTSGVFFRRYAANGTAIDTTDKRANAAVSGTQINPGVAIDTTGNIVVLWQDTSKLYFQRILTAESAINGTSGTWSAGRVQIDNVLSTSDVPSIAMDAAGNFVVAYREQSILPGIWLRGFKADGTQKFVWNQAASGSATSPSIAMAADGQFILTWQDSGDGDGTGIYARKYLANGTANGAAFVVNQYTTGNQNQSSVTMLDPQNFVVVWSGVTATDSYGVALRQYGTTVPRTLIAQNDYVTTATNTSVNVDALANDSRPSKGVAVLLDVANPAYGTATVTTAGTITYTPDTSYAGDDTLTYLISDAADGTTHYWGLGGTAIDSVGVSDGTLNGTTAVAGRFGTALQFNEISDYVRNPDLRYNSSFSVSFDFKLGDNTGTAYQYFYSHGTWNATNSLQIFVGEAGNSTDANVLKTAFGDSTDTFSASALNTNIASLIGDGQWHTYTLVVDKTNGSRVYIDGALRTTAATRGGDAFDPAGSLYMGARSDRNSTQYFGGQLDSVRIFNRALALTEVSSLNTGNSPSASSVQSTAAVNITVQNAAPTAVTNGPYTTSAGLPVTFSAAGSSDLNGDTLTYEWDLNYDGVTFSTDASGATVSKTWAQLQANGSQQGTNSIALKVTDSRGAETQATTTLQFNANAAPTAIVLSNSIVPGSQAGATVGTLTTTDTTAGDSQTYTVSDTRFEVVSGQLKLKAGQSVNRDTETAVTMNITTTDMAGNQFSRSFTLTVGHGLIVARDNIGSTTENSTLTVAAPGVLINDDRPSGSVTPGAMLEYNAAQDTNADGEWQNSTGISGVDLALGTGVARNAVTPSNHYGILSSFEFNGATTSGAFSKFSAASLPGNPTDGAGTFELWFRPDELTKKHILIDSGSAQPGSGLSLRLNGTQLEYCVYSGTSQAVVTSNIITQLGTADFVQFTGTVQMTGGTASIEMFVNGVSAGTDTRSGFTSWSDITEDFALGNIDGSMSIFAVSGADPFAGEMSLFRFYDSALTSTQIQNNFNAVAGTQTGITVSSTDTTTDAAKGSVTIVAGGSVVYNPNAQFEALAAGATATDSFRYTITDGSGNTDTARVTVTITGVNDAPVLASSSGSLGTIVANTTSTAMTVASVPGSSVTDVDTGSVQGIAVTGTTGTGAWQYSTNGTTWLSFGTVSTSTSLLLRSTDQIRFVGSGTSAGAATISFAAWDQSTGSVGSKVDLGATGRGGTTAYSTASNTAMLTLTRFNIAPIALMNGPYVIAEGQDVAVSAAGSSDPDGDTLTYEWDLNDDTFFGNATGISLTRTWAQMIAEDPAINDNGVRNIRLRVTDTAGLSTIVTTTLSITNTAPTISVSGNATVDSGATYVLNLTATDPGQDTISAWTINWGDGSPAETVSGSLISASHVYTTPGGTRSITVSGTDEDGSYPMTGGPFLVSVNNSAPDNLALSDLRVTEGIPGALVGTLTFTDVDFGDRHTITVDDSRFEVVSGELRLRAGQSLNYATENTVQVNITVTDLNSASTTSGFLLNVNRVALGGADFYAVNGTQQLSVSSPSLGVLSNDTDPENDSMMAIVQTGPANAAAFGMNSNGTFWYRANAGFSGVDTFTYFINDGESNSSSAVVTLTVNQPATLDFVRTRTAVDENTVLNTRLRIGQFVITDDGLGSNSITLAGTDAAFFELDGSNVLYLKAGVSLDYETRRGFLVTGQVDDVAIAGDPDNIRNVAFAVRNVNELPTTSGISDVTVNEDAGLRSVSLATRFADPDNESLAFSVTTVSQSVGLLDDATINGTTGTLNWQAASNAFGTAVLRVTATDAAGASVSTRFTITVQPVNDAPILLNYSGSTFAGHALTVTAPGVLLDSSDVDNSSISAVLIQAPLHGTVTLRADGSFTYVPATSYFGTDSFQFAGSDGLTTGATMTASIVVQPPFIATGSSGTTSTDNRSTTTSENASGSTTNSTISGTGSGSSTSSTSNGTTNATAALAGYGITGSTNHSDDDNSLLTSGAPGQGNSHDDAMTAGFLPQVQVTEGDGSKKLVSSAAGNLSSTDRETARRYSSGDIYGSDSETTSEHWDTHTALTPLELQRQQFYRELAARTEEQIDSFEKKLSRNVSMDGRVVGSVGVVTTGFSVGYLIWAVRGGMLLSGVLSQIPAWTMLDPLLVIDGEGKDDDKESLQTIMDREQARLNKTPSPTKT